MSNLSTVAELRTFDGTVYTVRTIQYCTVDHRLLSLCSGAKKKPTKLKEPNNHTVLEWTERGIIGKPMVSSYLAIGF